MNTARPHPDAPKNASDSCAGSAGGDRLGSAAADVSTMPGTALNRPCSYQRGVLASGGGSIDTVISLPDTDEQRDYVLDGLGNWKETDYTPVGGALTEETRNHNKLNQIIKRQPDDGDPWIDFTHDLNGNLTDDGVRTYEWDALNRLYRVKRKSDDKTIAEYVCNALNHRIRKTVSNGGLSGNVPNGQTNFIYNSGWQCLEERDGSDGLLRQYVWGVYIDELLQMREVDGESSDDRYPLQDLLYRTTALTDDSGAIVEAYDTDAYGNTLIFDSPGTGDDWWANDASQADVPACAFIFTGRRFDPETELYQYRNRYYAPKWGRFVSRDPISIFDSINFYLLGEGNPLRRRDPYGLFPCECKLHYQPPATVPGCDDDSPPLIVPVGGICASASNSFWADCICFLKSFHKPTRGHCYGVAFYGCDGAAGQWVHIITHTQGCT